jgi:uncharacterized membrane protein (UPF0127 family)
MTSPNRRFIPFLLPLLSVLLVGLSGCDQQTATTKPSGLPIVSMKIGSMTFNLEVADDDYSRTKGLMERDTLPADHGMIFVFPVDTSEGFWMHHTRFPLDILFVDQSGKIVSVHNMKAYDESTTSSDGLYRYAIELPSGAAASAGVKAGDTLTLPKLSAPTTNQ